MRQFWFHLLAKSRPGAGYPDEFVQTLTAAGWLAALIPQPRGVAGFELASACSDVLPRIREAGEKLLAQALGKAIAALVEVDGDLVIQSAGRVCDTWPTRPGAGAPT